MTENIDDVAQTLAEYERLAISSGAKVQIDPPEFMAGPPVGDPFVGTGYLPFWSGDVPPTVARATVHRDGVPTTVYVSWDESLPAEDSWRALWERKPMKLFGAYVLRAALRRAFRDVIGDRREPDEKPAPGEPSAEPVEVGWDAGLDWDEALHAAPNIVELDKVWAKMRHARARTGAREVAYKARHAELIAAEWTPGPVIDPAIDLSPEEAIRSRAFFPETGDSPAPFAPVPARRVDSGASAVRPDVRVPQDYKHPLNRAARRAGKKGRR